MGKRGYGARYAGGSGEALKRTPYNRSPTNSTHQPLQMRLSFSSSRGRRGCCFGMENREARSI
jgi:hypothetical protein